MITLQNIEKQFGAKILYNDISASINPAQRIGLIGPNGAGKTILLKVLAGEEGIDSGKVIIPSNIKIAYLPQELTINQNVTPISLVLEPFAHLFEIESVIEKLSSCKDVDSNEYRKAMQEYDKLHTELDIHDAYSLDARAKAILAGLGVKERFWEKPISNLSGGYQMRVQLTQLLLMHSNFLLLDEPTNHLDIDALIWLEKFLQRFKGGMLIVSHDRDFLNRVTANTIEVSNGTMFQYSGTVDGYFEWKKEHTQTEVKRVKNLQDKIDKTEQFINKFKSKATKASQARSKMKHLEKLKEQLPEQSFAVQTIHFQFPEPKRCGSVPLKLEQVTVSYGKNVVLNNLSLTITRGDKIAIIGPNGAGKSTLLKTLFEEIQPVSGTVISGHNTDIKYYSQHRLEQLNPQKTVFETIAEISGIGEKNTIQSLLGAFLFRGDETMKKVSVLSGGEKSRLSLACLLADPGNVLLLDEPTNHLDLQSVERLANALSKFKGTMVIVSHDEYFISQITNRIIELRPEMYRDFPGSLSDYRAYIEEGYIDPFSDADDSNQAKNDTKTLTKQERIKKRQERKTIERKIEKIERTIEETETKIEELKLLQHDPSNAHDFDTLNKITQDLKELQNQYETFMESWEQLQHQLEMLE